MLTLTHRDLDFEIQPTILARARGSGSTSRALSNDVLPNRMSCGIFVASHPATLVGWILFEEF
jgi:hypothetical protein